MKTAYLTLGIGALVTACAIIASPLCAGDFTGTVRDEDGKPLRWVCVTCESLSGSLLSESETGADGKWSGKFPNTPTQILIIARANILAHKYQRTIYMTGDSRGTINIILDSER